jgi:hypothetical protein
MVTKDDQSRLKLYGSVMKVSVELIGEKGEARWRGRRNEGCGGKCSSKVGGGLSSCWGERWKMRDLMRQRGPKVLSGKVLVMGMEP